MSEVLGKYRAFVNDYSAGMEEAALCAKYRIKEQEFDAFLAFLKRKGFQLKRTMPGGDLAGASFDGAHEIDYEIFGDDMQYVVIELDPGETGIAEAGAMMYMEDGIDMQTIFGDGSQEHDGVMGRIFGAGKRVLTGESLFMTAFTNLGSAKRKVAFSAPHPGAIVPLDLAELGGSMICQKDAFLCAAKGIAVGIAFQKRLGVGFFGGEGFILQRLDGDGLAFVHAGGALLEKELGPGESLRIDTGCIVAFQPSVHYDIKFVGGVKTAIFGGEGFFFAQLRGPGRVWLQSMPFSRLADKVLASAPRVGGDKKGEGSLLGTIGNILND